MIPWIGVGLDGTLAEYHGWTGGDIGKPIEKMVERVKKLRDQGTLIKIMTARIAPPIEHTDLLEMREKIDDWTFEVFGQSLPITCSKDFGMIDLYDDRCTQVETNTGELMCEVVLLKQVEEMEAIMAKRKKTDADDT